MTHLLPRPLKSYQTRWCIALKLVSTSNQQFCCRGHREDQIGLVGELNTSLDVVALQPLTRLLRGRPRCSYKGVQLLEHLVRSHGIAVPGARIVTAASTIDGGAKQRQVALSFAAEACCRRYSCRVTCRVTAAAAASVAKRSAGWDNASRRCSSNGFQIAHHPYRVPWAERRTVRLSGSQ